MKSATLLALAAIALFSTSCVRIGKGQFMVDGEKITVPEDAPMTSIKYSFSKEIEGIKTSVPVDVDYEVGALEVILTCPKIIAQYVDVVIEGSCLTVKCKKGVQMNNGGGMRMTMKVSAPRVSQFTTTGTGDFKIKDLTQPLEYSFRTSGTGDFTISSVSGVSLQASTGGTGDIDIKSIKVKDLDLSSSGTGDIDIKTAQADAITLITNGTGDIDLIHGICKTIDMTTNGTGDIEAHIEADEVTGRASGTGDIKVAGTCRSKDLHKSGIASIKDRSLKIQK